MVRRLWLRLVLTSLAILLCKEYASLIVDGFCSYRHFCRFQTHHYAGPNNIDWDPKAAPKLDFNEDYYAVIESEPTATSQELKKAYYRTVFKYHPDK